MARIKTPTWTVKKDGGSYWLDGPFTDTLKYQDRRGDAIGMRMALVAAFEAGVKAGIEACATIVAEG